MRGSSPTSAEPRQRLFFNNEDSNRRRFLRSRVLKDGGDKAYYSTTLDRILSCKFLTLKLVLFVLIIGAFLTLLRSPSIHETDHTYSSHSRSTLVDRWIRDRFGIDQSYAAFFEIKWDEISSAIDALAERDKYKGIGLLNFDEHELNRWKELFPEAEHVMLMMDYAPHNVTWETLYPEWLDEEGEFEVPTCPALPKIHYLGKPRLDLVAVKLPCDKKSNNWSRDVARLHLQLEAARLAATVKGNHPVHVLLVTECFPKPNLFTCKDAIVREGSAWLYKPDLHKLREKLQLPVGSCELSVPLQAKENWYSGSAKREAYATILHSAHFYVCGAIVAAQSIRMSGSTRDLVILVDDTITDYHRGGLEAAGWKIHTIQRIRNPKAERDAYNEWNYSKFRLWQLTDYDKIIFIDADLLVLRNIDFLFEMPEISATGNNATLFNSGVMVIEPSNCTFQLLMDHINEIESYNGGDQGYLNEVFTWWHRIPKHMNFLKHFWVGDEEEKKEMKTRLFGADPPVLYVLHYLGLKPWLCFRDYDCNWNNEILQEFASDVAHKTWWKIHDAMPENLHKYCLLRSKQKAALEWDRRQAEKGNYSDGHWKIKIQDPRLTTCFEDFCFWESMLWHWGEKNWTDNATVVPPSASL
ncbi:putative UDP-glucuronate:xylan alpha-glucuronosyltransferase 3 [Andrographis paniculata]|uniref:putative UDP-glucuronate:xylan alpha-glucuronosyltransferase 3 n=1 Tax=Andrographis paniculata TaxID=175694 RepID=UPI0021E8C657|nr:putative UDP-glucuronate:xylan alpha-glucuronosyltransferase 3 [Andrographis paniculata]